MTANAYFERLTAEKAIFIGNPKKLMRKIRESYGSRFGARGGT
jgi:hypothetical protein